MEILYSILSFLLSLTAAAYLQLPTFILALGYRWFHQYKFKRWIFRTLAIAAFTAFILQSPPTWAIIVTGIPVVFLFVFSLLNANPKVYVALTDEFILKQRNVAYNNDDEILGYVDEAGNSIAYPLQALVKPRHLLNDIFIGNPLFVSYCMACRSAMVYNPVVNGIRLHFEVLGVYRRNMVMGDVETGTVWQQGTGEALFGELKGSQLQYLPYQQMTIKEWLLLHPDSLIAYESEKVKDGIFSKDRLMKMMKITERIVTPGKTNLQGLALREKVFGVLVNEEAKAYPISELKKINRSFVDYVGNTQVSVEYDSVTNYIKIWVTETGTPLVAQSHWWFGWKEFHPNTKIWMA